AQGGWGPAVGGLWTTGHVPLPVGLRSPTGGPGAEPSGSATPGRPGSTVARPRGGFGRAAAGRGGGWAGEGADDQRGGDRGAVGGQGEAPDGGEHGLGGPAADLVAVEPDGGERRVEAVGHGHVVVGDDRAVAGAGHDRVGQGRGATH